MSLMRRLAVTLACVSAISACSQRAPRELACDGQVNFGGDVTADRFILRVDGDAIEIRGEPGTAYTFDGAMYKVCSESPDEVEFEYVAQCGSGNPTRSGELQKVGGELKLSRYDMGKPFTGMYKCKRVNRALGE
ncbi:hypothetical protein AU374_06023 [Cupriavidus metallidurans]|jgi:hypothetical protein|nr:hypothetical protein AU374_06023 [Cupriavidus metallidurans]